MNIHLFFLLIILLIIIININNKNFFSNHKKKVKPTLKFSKDDIKGLTINDVSK